MIELEIAVYKYYKEYGMELLNKKIDDIKSEILGHKRFKDMTKAEKNEYYRKVMRDRRQNKTKLILKIKRAGQNIAKTAEN